MDSPSKFALSLATKFFSVPEFLATRAYRSLLDSEVFDNYLTEEEGDEDAALVFRGATPDQSRHVLRVTKGGLVYVNNSYDLAASDQKSLLTEVGKVLKLIGRLPIVGADVSFMDIKEEFVTTLPKEPGRDVYRHLLSAALASFPSSTTDSYVNVEIRRRVDSDAAHVVTIRIREHEQQTVWSWFSGYALLNEGLWLNKSPSDTLNDAIGAYFRGGVHGYNVQMYNLLAAISTGGAHGNQQ